MTRIETGSCFCGSITAEMDGDPFWICSDHDDDCRKAIGSPLTVWVGYRPAQFRLLTGWPKTFSRTRGVLRTFCADCGTSIAYLDQGLPEELYVTIGFFNHPERFAPQAHAYWGMKLPWVEFRDDLPRVGRFKTARSGSRKSSRSVTGKTPPMEPEWP